MKSVVACVHQWRLSAVACLLAISILLSASSPVQAAAQNITMGSMLAGGLVFSPPSVTVNSGDTVTWSNNALGPHNVIFDAAPEGVETKTISLNSLTTKAGNVHQVTFTVPGTYSYYCTPIEAQA
jgi:plastocyanin